MYEITGSMCDFVTFFTKIMKNPIRSFVSRLKGEVKIRFIRIYYTKMIITDYNR